MALTARRSGRGRNRSIRQQPTTGSDRELIVIMAPGAEPTTLPQLMAAATGKRGAAPAVVADIKITPLFRNAAMPRAKASAARRPAAAGTTDLDKYFHVAAPDNQLDKLADSLLKREEVEAAYVKPKGEPPVDNGINDMPPSDDEPPAVTPDFTGRQLYLEAAPGGVDARYAWQFPGGRGQGVRIIDCEWGWRFTHEDLIQNQGGVVIGTPSFFTDHGTAVIGEIGGDLNSFGITGICSDSSVSAASFATLPTASVIRQAADRLQFGDILLLEIHRQGPDGSGSGQDGYIGIEWWPDDFAAIQYAVSQGIIVVEAAGNGARDLDAPIFEQPLPGFPAWWTNPFNPANPSSGAVLVGAGAPPPGTHGVDHGPDRSRLGFSNYGRRVDVQGWGREVTTTGYGDLQGGSNEDRWYTDRFSGTSSASPIIVGVLGCLQGILRARHRPELTPDDAIRILRATGSPQQDGPAGPRTQRIGNRPDLRQLIPLVLGSTPEELERMGEKSRLVTIGSEDGRVIINVNTSRVTLNINGD